MAAKKKKVKAKKMKKAKATGKSMMWGYNIFFILLLHNSKLFKH